MVASLVAEHKLQGAKSSVAAHGWVVLPPDSRAWAQYLWHTSSVSLGHVETSWTRELEPVSSALVGRF